jgi:outer membrane protein TolC
MIGESADKAESFERSKYSNINFTGIIPEEIASSAITKRPDYLKAEKMVEKVGIDVKVAKKEFLPTLNIGGLALFNASDLGSLLTVNNAIYGLTGGVFANLFTGGRKMSNLKIKKSEYERVLKNYEKTNLVAIQEINDSLVSIKNDKQKFEDCQKILKLELKDYRMAELKYENGVISKLDLNQVKENLLDVNKLIVNNNCELWTDYLSLYKAVGSDL